MQSTTDACNLEAMEKMAKRIEQALMAKNRGNQSEMARFVGVSPQAVQKWIAGDTEPKGKNLQKAAEFLGVTEAWLKFGIPVENATAELKPEGANERVHYLQTIPKSNIRALHPDDVQPEGTVSIKQSKIFFSAGNGHQVTYEIIEDSEPATYQLSWFQKHGINPEHARRFKVVGDSQEPMLFEGDTVLVNLKETDIIDGKLYAIRYGSDLRIKYLRRRLDGTLLLRSVNPSYKDEEVPREMAEEHISIIGRVRDKSGSGGL
jgi:phage repressor protein C with HTH and peptisase S24 domain